MDFRKKKEKPLYIVTGGAGFIGSAFVWKLNEMGIDNILVVDALGDSNKWKNLVNRRYADFIHKDAFLDMVQNDCLPDTVEAVIHMGACSSTSERDADYLMENNFHYTVTLAQWALEHNVRFLTASSGATYGAGEHGFSDDDTTTPQLRPINMYGYSKQLFDLWALRHNVTDKLASLKFFNVFGPNEYHKGDMASMLFHGFHQIRDTSSLKLFKSANPDYTDGEFKRDFVYVKDCVNVMAWLLEHPNVNGIFNVGTGTARTWNDLARAMFAALAKDEVIDYIDMPAHLQPHYQYFTEAKMEKLRAAGYDAPFTTLEDAAREYVRDYLATGDPYL